MLERVEGALLAEGDRAHAVAGHAQAGQVVAHGARTLVAEGQVVVDGAALVAVALDRHLGRAMVLQPEAVLLEQRARLVAQLGPVVVEADVFERSALAARVVDGEVLAAGAAATGPRSCPARPSTGCSGSGVAVAGG